MNHLIILLSILKILVCAYSLIQFVKKKYSVFSYILVLLTLIIESYKWKLALAVSEDFFEALATIDFISFILLAVCLYDEDGKKINLPFFKSYLVLTILLIGPLYYYQILSSNSNYNGFKITETIFVNQKDQPRKYKADNDDNFPKALNKPLEVVANSDEFESNYDYTFDLAYRFTVDLEDSSKESLFNRIDQYNSTTGKEIDIIGNEILKEFNNNNYSEEHLFHLFQKVDKLHYQFMGYE
jgi:hypothetical protein